MKRVTIEKRPNMPRLVESQGLVYARTPVDPDVQPGKADPSNTYWPDNRYYSFTSEEIALLERSSRDVFDMCCEAADYLVEHPEVVTGRMAVPAFCLRQIRRTWEHDPPMGSVYGRFDVCFGGLDHEDPRLRVPKYYEFNADTPTSLLEAGSIQWLWLEQTGHGADQFNSLCERLVEAWERNLGLLEDRVFAGRKLPVVHFSAAREDESGEEIMNTTLLMELCRQAGWMTKAVYIEDIELRRDGRFYDPEGEHIDVVFKLYPWEDMVRAEFGEPCFRDMENVGLHDAEGKYIGGTVWIEPPYKMLWSNKALWAIMWQLFKDDPRSRWLLPTYFDGEQPEAMRSFARKPIFSREGADVTLHDAGKVVEDASKGWYGKEGHVVQELALLPEYKVPTSESSTGSVFTVLGVWFVDGEPAGMGIREDRTAITANTSAFIPHSICDAPLNYERRPIPDLDEIEATLSMTTYADRAVDEKRVDDVLTFIERVTI